MPTIFDQAIEESRKTALPAETGKTVFELAREQDQGVQARPGSVLEAAKRGWQRGNVVVDMGLLGESAKSGQITDEEAFRQAKAMEQEMAKTPPLWSPFEWGEPSTWLPAMFESAAEFTPFMARGFLEAFKMGTAGAAAGATGAAIFGQAGPQIAIPEEVVTVPVGAGAGYTIGATVGFIDFTRKVEGGHVYLQMRRKDVSREIAGPIADVVGLVNGVIEISQWGRILKRLPGGKKVFGLAVARVLTKSPTLLKALQKFAGIVAKDAFTELGEEQLQELTSTGGEALGHLLKSLEEDAAYQGPDAQELLRRQEETLRQTMGVFLLPIPGAAIQTLGGVRRPIPKGPPKTAAELARMVVHGGDVTEVEIKPPIGVPPKRKVPPVKVAEFASDSEGKPITFYRGISGPEKFGLGRYFTTSAKDAGLYAKGEFRDYQKGAAILPVHLKIKNTLNLDTAPESVLSHFASFEKWRKAHPYADIGKATDVEMKALAKAWERIVIQPLRKLGYDSFVNTDKGALEMPEWYVFDASSIVPVAAAKVEIAVTERARVDKEVAEKKLNVRVDEPQLGKKGEFLATQVTLLEEGYKTSILVKPGESVEEKVKQALARKTKKVPAAKEVEPVEVSEEERLLEEIRKLPLEDTTDEAGTVVEGRITKARKVVGVVVPDSEPFEQEIAVRAAIIPKPFKAKSLVKTVIRRIIKDGAGAISDLRAEELAVPALAAAKEFGLLTRAEKGTKSLEGLSPGQRADLGLPSLAEEAPSEVPISRDEKADQQARESLSEPVRRYLNIMDLLSLVVAPRTVAQRACQVFAKELGIDLVFVDWTGGALAERSYRTIIMQSSQTDLETLSSTLHHEVAHIIGADEFEGLPDEIRRKARESYTSKWERTLGAESLRQTEEKHGPVWLDQEANAYLIGEVFRNGPLSSQLRSAKPGLWKRIVDTLRDLATTFLESLDVWARPVSGLERIDPKDVRPLLDFYLAKLEESRQAQEGEVAREVGLGEEGLPSPPVSNLSLSENVLLGTLQDDKQLSDILQARAALRAGQESFEGRDLRGETVAGLTWLAWQRISDLPGPKLPRGLLEGVLGVDVPVLPKSLTRLLQQKGGKKKVRNLLSKEYHRLLDSVFGPKKIPASKVARETFLQERVGQVTSVGLEDDVLYSLIEELSRLEIAAGRAELSKSAADPVEVQTFVDGIRERISKGEIFPDQVARLVVEVFGELAPLGYRTKWDRTTRSDFKSVVKKFNHSLERTIDEATLRRKFINNPRLAELTSAALSTGFKRRGGKPHRWMDMRYNMMSLEKLTGLPFHTVYLSLMSQHNRGYLEVAKLDKRLFEVMRRGQWSNKLTSARIDRWLATGESEGMSDTELAAAKELKAVFDEWKPTVEFLRVHNWIQAELFGTKSQKKLFAIRGKFPNKKSILAGARKAWIHGGSNELEAFLAGLHGLTTKEEVASYLGITEAEVPDPRRMLGVITDGWTPLDHVLKRLPKGTVKPIPGKGHLMRRGFTKEVEEEEGFSSLEFWYEGRLLLQRVHSSLLQYHTNRYVVPHLEELQDLHRTSVKNGLYGKSEDKVIQTLGNFSLDLLNAPTERGLIADAAFALYNLTAASVFVLPRLGLRNLFQNIAMYPIRRDIAKALVSEPMTEEMMTYFTQQVSQIQNIKRALMSIGPQQVPGLGKLVELANRLSMYAWTDDQNRLGCFKAAYLGTRKDVEGAEGLDAQTEALSRSRHWNFLEPFQQSQALQLLGIEGKEEAMMYVAKEVTNNVHFVYDRAARAPMEHRTLGRLIGNLLTFPRSVFQRYAMLTNQAIRGPRRFYALRKLTNLVVGMYLTGELFRLLTRDKRNPYNPLEILAWRPGGLQLGMAVETAETVGHLLMASSGWIKSDEDLRKRELGMGIRGLSRAPKMHLPFYNIVISFIEAATDKKDLTHLGIREMRAALERGYRSPREKHQVERSFHEACMHALLANRAGEDPKRKKRSNVLESAGELVGRGLERVTEE